MVKKKKTKKGLAKRGVTFRKVLRKSKQITVDMRGPDIEDVLHDKQRFFTGEPNIDKRQFYFK